MSLADMYSDCSKLWLSRIFPSVLFIWCWDGLLFIISGSWPLSQDYPVRERSGSVVECLTRNRRVAGSSLPAVIALCP